jgi:hypothetical protein
MVFAIVGIAALDFHISITIDVAIFEVNLYQEIVPALVAVIVQSTVHVGITTHGFQLTHKIHPLDPPPPHVDFGIITGFHCDCWNDCINILY